MAPPEGAAPLTWQSRDALPEKEGEAISATALPQPLRGLEDLRGWCEERSECVGFALRREGEDPEAWGFYPKKRDTGFEAGTAKWNDRKYASEKWEFHYIKERAGPQQESALPEFMADTTASWSLAKLVLDYGPPGSDDAGPKLGDAVEYRVHRVVLDGREVPGVVGDTRRGLLGEGLACEAVEFGLQRMRPGERAKLTGPWALVSAAPPPPTEAAEALVEGGAKEAEIVVELLSVAAGPETQALKAIEGPDGHEEEAPGEEAKEARKRQIADLLVHAQNIKEVGTRLYKSQRLLLALSRYLQLLELLAILDFDAKLDQVDPLSGMLGLTPTVFKEGQQELKTLLGDDIVQQAKALLLAARLNVALCWLQLKEWRKAAGACKSALDIDASNIKALYRMAQAKIGLDECEEARASLQELLKIDPEHREGKRLLAEATQKCREERAAERERGAAMRKALERAEAKRGGALEAAKAEAGEAGIGENAGENFEDLEEGARTSPGACPTQ